MSEFTPPRTTKDTSPDAERVQIELLRAMTPARRFALMCSMTDDAIFRAKRAIEIANPGLSQRERDLIFMEVHYGKNLAANVRQYLKERDVAGIGHDPSPASGD